MNIENAISQLNPRRLCLLSLPMHLNSPMPSQLRTIQLTYALSSPMPSQLRIFQLLHDFPLLHDFQLLFGLVLCLVLRRYRIIFPDKIHSPSLTGLQPLAERFG